jgi:cation transport ATPase
MISAQDGPSPELRDMTRRFWIGGVLTIPVVILEMGRHLIDVIADAVSTEVSNWAQLMFATPVVLWAGWPFFVRGLASLRTRNLNMFTLIAMGTGVAWLYSVVATLTPGIFPATFRSSDMGNMRDGAMSGALDVYFEAAASSPSWCSWGKC